MSPSTNEWRVTRDRVLLYIRSMELPPLEDLAIVAESLESAVSISPEEAMKNLFALLQERNLHGDVVNERGERIVSAPPLNRGVMVAEPMDRVPWKTAFVRFLRRWRRELFGQEGRRES